MYKIIDLKSKSKLAVIWTDKCEYKLLDIIVNDIVINDFLLLPPLPWKLINNINFDNFNNVIVNDFWTLEFFKFKKSIYLWRIIISSITRDFKNIKYFFDKFSDYNIKWLFISYSDYFSFDYELIIYLKSKKIKLWVFINEDMVAYSPRCHYMVYKKDKWDFSTRDCKLYCENENKESVYIVWAKKNAILDYKLFLFKNNDYSKIKEDKVKFKYIDYLIY